MSSLAVRRLTKAGLVVALVLGISVVLVMDRGVALSVDGERSTVRTFGGTVGDVLEKQGIRPGQHDVVTPAASTPVDEGQEITVRHACELTVSVDGRESRLWTTAPTVGEALEQAEIRHDRDDEVVPGAGRRVTDGMTITIDRVGGTATARTETTDRETAAAEDGTPEHGGTRVEGDAREERRSTTPDAPDDEAPPGRPDSSPTTQEPIDEGIGQGPGRPEQPATSPSSPAERPSSASPPPRPPTESSSDQPSSERPSASPSREPAPAPSSTSLGSSGSTASSSPSGSDGSQGPSSADGAKGPDGSEGSDGSDSPDTGAEGLDAAESPDTGPRATDR